MPEHSRTIFTAYTDAVTVFVNDSNDIKALSRVLDLYERASSAKVNWDKTEAFWSGERNLETPVILQGRVLVANELLASALWHKFIVLEPPAGLVQDIQWILVNVFWSGQLSFFCARMGARSCRYQI